MKRHRCAVIGDPVSHSKSPRIHTSWLEQYGIPGSYDAIAIPAGTLADGVKRLITQGYTGFNVTIPHKEHIMALCARLDDTARAIGAVNTVRIETDGTLSGFNTDSYGFLENLRQNFSDTHLPAQRALVLGAGGAARAVMAALTHEGVADITVTNRNPDRAEQLAQTYGARTAPWDKRSDAASGRMLIINTTSLGMNGQPPLDIDLAGADKNAIVYDLVYAPLETPLLKAAAAHGLRPLTGIGMLLYQAQKAFEIWTGTTPAVTDDLTRRVLAA